MTNVTLYRNGVSLTDFDTFIEVTHVGDLLMRELNGVWPETAKIYHGKISQEHDVTPIKNDQVSVDNLLALEGHLFVVVYPEAFIPILVWVAIALSVVAIGLAFLLRPSTQGQNEGSPNNELSDRQNKPRPNERIPDIFGTVRSTPDLIAFPYKTFKGGEEFEQAFMAVGRGYYDVLDCKDGTTPVEDIAGEFVAVYDPFTGPNSVNNTPAVTFGTLPTTIDPVVCVQPCSAVNGQILRAPNSGSVQAQDNFAFADGGIIITNDSNIDLTQYFVASTLTQDQFLIVQENPAGQNADDPAGIEATVGLGGTYKILSVTQSQIVLSHPELVNPNWNALASFLGGQSAFYHTFWIVATGDKWVGPFLLEVANLDRVWCNFVVAQGLYYIDNKGRQGALHVTVKVGVQAVDSTGTPIGDEIYGTVNLSGSSLNKNITGATSKMELPSEGPCQVRALLITDMATDTRNSYSQQVQWRDLFAVSPITFELVPPVPPPTGVLVAFAQPNTASTGPSGPTNGYTFASPSGFSQVQMTSSNPLGNWYFAAIWDNFALPADMPPDAVITAILPVLVMESSGTSGGAEAQAFAGLTSSLNPFTPIPGGEISNPGGFGDLQGVVSYPDLTHSLGTDVTTLRVVTRTFQSALGGPYNTQINTSKVVMAVYYTSASGTKTQGITAAFGDFGNVTTVLAITAQTADALTVKERKCNLLVTRKVPTWINRTDPGAPQFSTTLYPSNNAADIMCAMSLDPFIGRRPLSQIDVAGIYGVADSSHLGGEHVDGEIATYFGTFLMTEFCATFDDSKVSFEEGLAQLAQTINCTAYRSAGSLIGLFFEKLTHDSKILFNHRNKLPDSETRTVTFGPLNDNDGIEYTYVEPNAPNLPQQDTLTVIYVPSDQSAVNAKKITSFGVRNYIQAQINAYRMYQKLILANTTTEFTALKEANQVLMTQRVLVADNTRQQTQDGDCIAIDGTGLIITTNRKLVWEVGHTYTIFIQHFDNSVESMAVTAGPNPDSQFVLSAAPSMDIVVDPRYRIRTLFIIVDDADDVRPLAFLISGKAVADGGSFKLDAICYTDDYYLHDQDVVNGYLLEPPSGYAPQGYIGQGLIKTDGTTYTPPARESFDSSIYTGSPQNADNNPDAPVTTPPTFATDSSPIQVEGDGIPAPIANFNDTLPAAVSGANVKFQKGTSVDVTTISAYVPPASTSGPGVAPTLPGNTTTFLRGDGTFAATASAGCIAGIANGGVAAPAVGSVIIVESPYGGTITGWSIIASDPTGPIAGSAVFNIKKSTISTIGSGASIIGSAPPTLTTAIAVASTTLTGWTTTVAAGDCFEFILDSASVATKFICTLQVQRS